MPHNNRKRIFLQLQHNMADNEVLAMMPIGTIERLRKNDPKPEIRVYGIGREGLAKGTFEGGSGFAVRYLQHAISALFEKLKFPTPAFLRHAATNSHDGRTKVGEIVGKTMRVVDGALDVLAAVYIYPEHRKRELDIASIETNAIAYDAGTGEAIIADLEDVTGIALSSSALDKPGFESAKLYGSLQFFTNPDTLIRGVTGEKDTKAVLTKKEILDGVKELGLNPSDLFDAGTLERDNSVIAFARREKQTEYEHAKRVEGKLESERADWLKKETALTGEITTLKTAGVKASAGATIESMAKDRKLTPKQTAFVKMKSKDFAPTSADKATEELTKFVDDRLNEFRDMVTIGMITDDGKPAPETTNQNGEQKPADNGGNKTPADENAGGNSAMSDATENPLADSKNNDFIPK